MSELPVAYEIVPPDGCVILTVSVRALALGAALILSVAVNMLVMVALSR